MAQESVRLPWWRRWFGSRSERAAARYLRRLGYRVLARNVITSEGELDLVALHEGCIVFVEVRSTAATDSPSRPAESVDLAKQRRLTQAALAYLSRHRLLDQPARFDVLALAWPQGQREPTIEHYPQAFQAVGCGQMYS